MPSDSTYESLASSNMSVILVAGGTAEADTVALRSAAAAAEGGGARVRIDHHVVILQIFEVIIKH